MQLSHEDEGIRRATGRAFAAAIARQKDQAGSIIEALISDFIRYVSVTGLQHIEGSRAFVLPRRIWIASAAPHGNLVRVCCSA